MIIRNFIKKVLLLISLAFCISYAQAQWQEITQYGPVKDFLYINDNLMYIWADVNYRVENDQARNLADFGFEKKSYEIHIINEADFIKGTMIGFKEEIGPGIGNLNVFRTMDGGISWFKFGNINFPDYRIWVTPIAIDSETVYFEGKYMDLTKPPMESSLPLIKMKKNNNIKFIDPQVRGKESWGNSTVHGMYFFDSLYGLGFSQHQSSTKYFLVRTTDGGKNFTVLDSDYFAKNNAPFFPASKKIMLVWDPYNISITSDSGFTWKKLIELTNNSLSTDTIITGLTLIKNNIFYIRQNKYYNVSNPTVSILYHKKIEDVEFDSIFIKPTQCIECYDTNRCFMYSTTFYKNILPTHKPLSNQEKSFEKHDIKPKLIYHPDHIELVFPTSIQNNPYQLSLYDMSGKLVLTGNIPKQTGNYELGLNENLPQGMYIISLRSKGEVFSLKFIK